ncbi:hypothetical protein U1Q18_013313 [Sarracenia purpurea var. burkii]
MWSLMGCFKAHLLSVGCDGGRAARWEDLERSFCPRSTPGSSFQLFDYLFHFVPVVILVGPSLPFRPRPASEFHLAPPSPLFFLCRVSYLLYHQEDCGIPQIPSFAIPNGDRLRVPGGRACGSTHGSHPIFVERSPFRHYHCQIGARRGFEAHPSHRGGGGPISKKIGKEIMAKGTGSGLLSAYRPTRAIFNAQVVGLISIFSYSALVPSYWASQCSGHMSARVVTLSNTQCVGSFSSAQVVHCFSTFPLELSTTRAVLSPLERSLGVSFN